MGGSGGGGVNVIQAPPPPPNPDINPQEVQQLAKVAADRYQAQVVTPQLQQINAQQQQAIPLQFATTGFFPEQQQQYAQAATAQVQDLYSQSSVSAELAAQQSMFQAGLASLQSMTSAAQQRAQLQAAQYQAYQQAAPQMAMGFSNLFGNNGQNQQQQNQGVLPIPGAEPNQMGGVI